jgi:hypothetical protein
VGPRACVALLCFLLAAPARAASPLARLASTLADEIVAAAKGRPVELAVPEDRTGRGAAVALDLRALVAARLEGRVALAETGPRLRIASVLSENSHRLVFSARVVEDPGDRLVDLLSASVEADDTLLALAPERVAAAGHAFDVLSSTRTPALEAPVLALELLDDDRVVVLSADDVSLYRSDGSALSQESRQALPGPLAAVRSPGGLIAGAARESALWVLTSRAPRAALLALEKNRLVRRSEAAALPWPGSTSGVRYRPGTNLLEGTLRGVGSGPFLSLAAGAQELAVLPDGRLRAASGESAADVRVGSALALLWPGVVAASSADPPGRGDAILLLAADAGFRPLDSLPLDGSIRALAGRTRGDTARLVAAVQPPGSGAHLVFLELRRRELTTP